MKYYVFPDIHGRNDLLQAALSFVYEQNPNGGKIVFLGDYIDRGSDNVGVLETVMNPPEGWEFVTLKGNHESMFVGGYNRLHEYYDMKAVKEIVSKMDLPSVVKWMDNLPIVHIEGMNIFAHAFYDPYLSPEQQVEDYVVWQRYTDGEPFRLYLTEGYYLTHGHTPRKYGPVKAMGRLNLDVGAVFYGRYVIAEFEEGVTGPVGFKEFEE